MNGKFIVIEGIDGCGKTTQIEAIYKWLPSSELMEKNTQVIKTREPGGTKFGQRIREILLANDQKINHLILQSFFYMLPTERNMYQKLSLQNYIKIIG